MSFEARQAGTVATSPRTLAADVSSAFPGIPAGPVPAGALASVPFARRCDRALADEIAAFIAGWRAESTAVNLHNLAVGLSGGVDSILTAALARRACRDDAEVTAVIVLIGDETARAHLALLADTATALGLEPVVVDGEATAAAMRAAWPETGGWSAINIETRVVQDLIFQVADSRRAGVLATTDRSEYLLGRYTEHFYGQIAPLVGLYKSEVLALAAALDLTGTVADDRPGCEGHWYDDEVLGAGYDVIDPLLHLLCEEKLSPEDICRRYAIADRAWVEALARRVHDQPLRTVTRCFSR